MSTLRELAAESIGRITRRGLESQLALAELELGADERTVAVAPGRDGAAGVLLVLTDARLMLSTAVPFGRAELEAHPVAAILSATAAPVGDTWQLTVEHEHGSTAVTGMFDRDAQRIAALLS